MRPDLQMEKKAIIVKFSGFEDHWKLGAKLIKTVVFFYANCVQLTLQKYFHVQGRVCGCFHC